jgi:hypothetical protein
MNFRGTRPIVLVFGLLICQILTGCGDSKDESALQLGQQILVRVGKRAMTVNDFNRGFHFFGMDYADAMASDPSDLKEAKQQYLVQEIEKMILLEYAHELNLDVSDAELEAAVAAIKKDFPDDTFEQTLIEQAVTYPVWEKQLKIRLLIDKVIKKEVFDTVAGATDEVRAHQEAQASRSDKGAGQKPKSRKNDQKQLKLELKELHQAKIEETYRALMKKLKEKYPIEINKAIWEQTVLLELEELPTEATRSD